MIFNDILKDCCLFCKGYNQETKICGRHKNPIKAAVNASCTFFTKSDKFESMDDVERAIKKCYGKSFEDVDPWKGQDDE